MTQPHYLLAQQVQPEPMHSPQTEITAPLARLREVLASILCRDNLADVTPAQKAEL